jgi:hypothetical protein
MHDRQLKIRLKATGLDLDEVISINELVPLLTRFVPNSNEWVEALTFLDPGVMTQGSYDGTGWSIRFVVVAE